MPKYRADIHPYNCADKPVQKNAIVNTHPDFFTFDPVELLGMVEELVTQISSPIVHHFTFASLLQSENEPIQSYLVRLRATALDCDFTSPWCEHDFSDIYIKDQLISELANDALQADLLAKTGTLRYLEIWKEVFYFSVKSRWCLRIVEKQAYWKMICYFWEN